MKKESIVYIRDTLFKGKDIKIIADNMRKYNTRTDCVIWDDNKELCYILRFNTNLASDQMEFPVTVDVFEYEVIQYLIKDTTNEQTEEILEELNPLLTVNNMSKEAIINYFKKIIQQ